MNKPALAQTSEPTTTAADDYPAAHSMDSTWWAVDGQGHVAQVNTGEAGAMPAAAGEQGDASDLVTLLAETGVPFYCDDLFSDADGKLHLRKGSVFGDCPTSYLLWLRDEAALSLLAPSSPLPNWQPRIAQRLVQLFTRTPGPPQHTSSSFPYLRLPVRSKVVVWIDGYVRNVPTRICELQASGVLLRAWGYGDWRPEVSRFGLFGYKLDTFDNWIAGPFEREAEPLHPLRLAELPAAVREAINFCPLSDHDFRREPLLQPFEAGESFAWGRQWVSTTGRVYSTSQHGPDLPERIARDVATPLVVPGESSLRALAAAYLSGESGAIDVLNDYLEEAGRPRLCDHAAPGARLDELLFALLTPDERTSVEIAMVEHVQPHSATPEIAAAAQQATEAMRKWLDGHAGEWTLQTAASAALAAWMPEDAGVDEQSDEEVVRSRDNGVAWAAWALARRWPLVPARTARTVHPDELAWQMQLVLERL